jgi:hypothetical protein
LVAYNGSGSTRTITRETFPLGAAPVAGYESKYFFRYDVSVAGSGATANRLENRMEQVQTFAGQTVTVSFWAKAAANETLPSVVLQQVFGTGGSPSATVSTVFAASVAVTTSWQRFSYTLTVPSISGKTIGTNGNDFLALIITLPFNELYTIDLWGFQVEAASTASNFQTATGTKQGELAACQRYYWRWTPTASTQLGSLGFVENTTNAIVLFQYPVSMRTKPTALEQSGTATDYSVRTTGGTATVCSAVPVFSNATELNSSVTYGVALGLVAGQACAARSATTNGYLGWSAEL